MGVIGLSLLVASVVLFCLRPPQWLPKFFATFRQQKIEPPPTRPPVMAPEEGNACDIETVQGEERVEDKETTRDESAQEATSSPSVPIIQEPMEEEPWIQVMASDDTSSDLTQQEDEDEDEEKVEEEPVQEAKPGPPTPIIHEPLIEVTAMGDTGPGTRGQFEKGEEQVKDEPAREAIFISPPPVVSEPLIQEPSLQVMISPSLPGAAKTDEVDEEEQEQTTPKAAATSPADSVPSLVLPEPSEPTNAPPTMPTLVLPSVSKPIISTPTKVSELRQPSRIPTPPSRIPSPPKVAGRSTSPRRDISPRRANMTSEHQQTAKRPAPPSFTQQPPVSASESSPSPSSMMPPPPVPKKPRPSSIPQFAGTISSSSATSSTSSPRRIPTLDPSHTTASPRRIPTLDPSPNRERNNLPIPRRGAPSSSSSLGGGLAPPPTHSSIPKKPSRQVTLEPGHSPMDWARLAQSPTSDLRGLPPNTPYLRVTPSMLKQMNGRKGRDAWSVYGGKVYNVSPYIKFHPGGAGELLRGAGKDATRLFGEVHPWVNYETMLSACLIGILVDEHETENKMEEMD